MPAARRAATPRRRWQPRRSRPRSRLRSLLRGSTGSRRRRSPDWRSGSRPRRCTGRRPTARAAAGAGAPAGQSHCQFQIQIVAPGGRGGNRRSGARIAVPTPVPDPDIRRGHRTGIRCIWCNTRRIITGSITTGISSHRPRRRRIGRRTGRDRRGRLRCRACRSALRDDAPRGCGCRLRSSGERRRRRLGGRRPGRYYRWYRR